MGNFGQSAKGGPFAKVSKLAIFLGNFGHTFEKARL